MSRVVHNISLRNFQLHGKLRLELSPTVTTIVGASDEGKSAIVRALRWVVFNRPGGTSFVRHGKRGAAVRVKVGKHIIVRSRKGSKNEYVLDGKRLVSFGRDVPKEVSAVFRLSRENFQLQHDSPFWLSLSSADASRELNRVVDLGMIDKSQQLVSKRVRRLSAEKRVVEEMEVKAEASRVKWSFAPKMKKDVSSIVSLREEGEGIVVERIALKHQMRMMMATQRRFKVVGGLLAAAEEAVVCARRLEVVGKARRSLSDVVCRLEDTQSFVRYCDMMKRPLFSQLRFLQRVTKECNGLRRCVKGITTAEKVVEDSGRRAAGLSRKLVKLMGKVCPLCDQKIG